MSTTLAARCSQAPSGWYCTRCEGHSGPCAVLPCARGPAPDSDDEITKTDLSDLLVIRMAELFGNLKAPDRKRVIEIISNWQKCSADRRACVEFTARELAKVPPEIT